MPVVHTIIKKNIKILVNAYQRVTGNNALFLLSTIYGDATAILFERLKLEKGLKGLIPEGEAA